jgi:hypothetical protein
VYVSLPVCYKILLQNYFIFGLCLSLNYIFACHLNQEKKQ